MRLFENGTCSEYLSSLCESLKKEVAAMADERIVNDDRAEWERYFIEKYSVTPAVLMRESLERDLEETQIKKSNPWFRRGFDYLEPEYYTVPGYKLICRVPFVGDRILFEKRSNPFVLRVYEVDSLGNTWRLEDDKIMIVHFDFEKTVLEGQHDVESYVDQVINQELDAIEEALARNESEVLQHNERLPQLVAECLQKRAERASSLAGLASKLKINLTKKGKAPSDRPVTLNCAVSHEPKKPLEKRAKTEPFVSDEDYSHICNIIDLACVSFESSSQTIKKLSEEEIRDLILSHLNSHYNATATGETFRRTGKTDIHIPLDGKSAFIAECKIWHGQKHFQKAAEQLLSYSTWRDGKMALVVFNKDNKDFRKVLDNTSKSLCGFATRHVKESENIWLCTAYRPNSSDEVKIRVMVYDLHLDE